MRPQPEKNAKGEGPALNGRLEEECRPNTNAAS